MGGGLWYDVEYTLMCLGKKRLRKVYYTNEISNVATLESNAEFLQKNIYGWQQYFTQIIYLKRKE